MEYFKYGLDRISLAYYNFSPLYPTNECDYKYYNNNNNSNNNNNDSGSNNNINNNYNY